MLFSLYTISNICNIWYILWAFFFRIKWLHVTSIINAFIGTSTKPNTSEPVECRHCLKGEQISVSIHKLIYVAHHLTQMFISCTIAHSHTHVNLLTYSHSSNVIVNACTVHTHENFYTHTDLHTLNNCTAISCNLSDKFIH